MTITARQTSTRIHAIRQLVGKLDALPLAVGEIHRRIADGDFPANDRQRAEDAGVRAIGGISDPTAQAALSRLAAHERYLADVEANLGNLAAAAANLCDVVGRWVVSAVNVEEHPRCEGGRSVDEWTRPDCTNWVSYAVRADGSLSYRQDGLCDACRMAKHRWERRSEVA